MKGTDVRFLAIVRRVYPLPRLVIVAGGPDGRWLHVRLPRLRALVVRLPRSGDSGASS